MVGFLGLRRRILGWDCGEEEGREVRHNGSDMFDGRCGGDREQGRVRESYYEQLN